MIPPRAKKVFSGVLHDVYQWPHLIADGTSITNERVVRKSSVLIIATVGNQVVTLYKKFPDGTEKYELVSAALEQDESPVVCAQRTLLEQTGYTSKQWQKKGYVLFKNVEGSVTILTAKNCSDGPEDLDESPIKLISYKQFIDLVSTEDIAQSNFIKQILNNELTDASRNILAQWVKEERK
jgi:hypothetical protein